MPIVCLALHVRVGGGDVSCSLLIGGYARRVAGGICGVFGLAS
jgi:hypothetical protein